MRTSDFQVLCEVPESYEAYKKQQHRWHSGPMHLFRLCLPAVLTSKVHSKIMLLVIKLNISNPTVYCQTVADIDMEESKLVTIVLPVEKAHPSLLFLHIVLHNSPFNYVCS